MTRVRALAGDADGGPYVEVVLTLDDHDDGDDQLVGYARHKATDAVIHLYSDVLVPGGSKPGNVIVTVDP